MHGINRALEADLEEGPGLIKGEESPHDRSNPPQALPLGERGFILQPGMIIAFYAQRRATIYSPGRHR